VNQHSRLIETLKTSKHRSSGRLSPSASRLARLIIGEILPIGGPHFSSTDCEGLCGFTTWHSTYEARSLTQKELKSSSGNFRTALSSSGHSPRSRISNFLFLGRLSKSQKVICCQVPNVKLPPTKGMVRLGPMMDALMCEWPLPSRHRR